jgi:two-component system, OmpR family, response regulator
MRAASVVSEPIRDRSLRIIVVDDDPDAVLTLMVLFRDEGHEVWGLYRAQEVMRAVTSFDPDVVLLDIALPGASGYTVAEEIRHQFGSTRPMLIAVTGLYKQPPHEHLSGAVGCNHFLTKPFDFAELLKMIAPLLSPATDRTVQ